jgi:hypothetical protein
MSARPRVPPDADGGRDHVAPRAEDHMASLEPAEGLLIVVDDTEARRAEASSPTSIRRPSTAPAGARPQAAAHAGTATAPDNGSGPVGCFSAHRRVRRRLSRRGAPAARRCAVLLASARRGRPRPDGRVGGSSRPRCPHRTAPPLGKYGSVAGPRPAPLAALGPCASSSSISSLESPNALSYQTTPTW